MGVLISTARMGLTEFADRSIVMVPLVGLPLSVRQVIVHATAPKFDPMTRALLEHLSRRERLETAPPGPP